MAKLIETLALAGSRKADGTANASGNVWAYVTGTSTQVTLYADAGEATPLGQPVALDAAGKATLYIAQLATLHVETAAGVSLGDIDIGDAPGVVAVRNAAFTGTLPSGSQGPGGLTTLDTILSSAALSFGGSDFSYLESPGSNQRGVAAALRDIWISVKDHGAVGDGLVDDTAAIQIAVNRVIALGGGTVKFPPGNYLVSTAIQNATAIPVSILGSGSASTIKNTSGTGGLFIFSGSGGYSFRDIYLDHATASSTGAAITVSSTYGLSFDNVQIHNHNIGISLTGSAIQDVHFNRVRVVTPYTTGARGIKVAAGVTESLRVTNSYLSSIDSEAALELAAGSYPLVVVSGTSFFGGISMASVVGPVSVFGCAFSSGTTNPLNITNVGAATILRQWANGLDGTTTTVVTTFTNVQPDWSRGVPFRVNCTGVGITVNISNPIPVVVGKGATMLFTLYNNNAGATTWFLDTLYRTGSAISTTTGVTTEISFSFDSVRNVWVETSRATHL